jgi:hypothetical protein
MELKGVVSGMFQLEKGMFFYADDEDTAAADYKRLVSLGVSTQVPCRAKVQLAKFAGGEYATAIIYPAEYDDEVSAWLLDNQYRTAGAAEGGTNAVQGYYDKAPEIIQRHQLFAGNGVTSRTGDELLTSLKLAVQR